MDYPHIALWIIQARILLLCGLSYQYNSKFIFAYLSVYLHGLSWPVDNVSDLAEKAPAVATARGSWRRLAIRPASAAVVVVLAPADENRPDAVEGLDAPDKGKNGRAAGASAVAGSLQSSVTESRRY